LQRCNSFRDTVADAAFNAAATTTTAAAATTAATTTTTTATVMKAMKKKMKMSKRIRMPMIAKARSLRHSVFAGAGAGVSGVLAQFDDAWIGLVQDLSHPGVRMRS